MSFTGVAPRAVTLTLVPPDNTPSIPLRAGEDTTLPVGGSYRLLVESTRDETVRYSFMLRIQ